VEVDYDVDGGVATITINAPGRRNAMTLDLVATLVDCFNRVASDLSIGAVVLRSEGPTFCSGADLALICAALPDPLAPEAFDGLGSIYELFETIVACPVPTIAAIQGPAVGAGVNLALACDVRIVSENAELAGFGRAGVHPGGGHFELLRSVDRQVAAWLAVCNQVLRGDDLVRTGVAISMAPAETLDAEVLRVAKAAAHDPALSRAQTGTFRTIDGGVARHAASVQMERAPQIWSLRRLHDQSSGRR
jgi:enoyl-CoA hydratase/carnithine racemase